MSSKRTAGGNRSAVIRCPNCGEDYSVTYKRCPFCDEKAEDQKRHMPEEDPDLPEEEGHASGGKRLGGGDHPWTTPRIIRTVVSLAVILAALVIVVTQVLPLVNRASQVTAGGGSPAPVESGAVDTAPPTVSPAPESAPPEGTPAPESQSPASQAPESQAPASQPPASQAPETGNGTASGITLSRADFTMNDRYPDPVRLVATLTPQGASGTVTWSSSNPAVTSVDANGLVTHGTENGQATITASLPNGVSETCTVRCNFTSSSSGGETSSSSGDLSLNRADFTLQYAGETFRMRVSGTSSTPTWSIGNTSVASISSDGTVTAVGEGSTTITCTVDGQTLTCIVRCSF